MSDTKSDYLILLDDIVSNRLPTINNELFPALLWVWIWDSIVNRMSDNTFLFNVGKRTIFNALLAEASQQGFTLEFGTEHLEEHLQDWLLKKDFMIFTDTDMEGNNA